MFDCAADHKVLEVGGGGGVSYGVTTTSTSGRNGVLGVEGESGAITLGELGT